jgi:hypothetical protein
MIPLMCSNLPYLCLVLVLVHPYLDAGAKFKRAGVFVRTIVFLLFVLRVLKNSTVKIA